MYTPSAKLNKKQHVERLQPGGFDGKAITRKHLIFVVRQKRAQAAAVLAAFWCRRDPLALEHIPDRRAPDVVPKLSKLTLELAVAPRRILLRQSQDQRFEFGADGRSA